MAIWTRLTQEAQDAAAQDSDMAVAKIITAAHSPAEAISRILSASLAHPQLTEKTLNGLFDDFIHAEGGSFNDAVTRDLEAILQHDPAAKDALTPFLFFKGFHALQAWRLSHHLWVKGRHHLACFVQSRICIVFGVDIHPAAKIGSGIMMDHATGIVIGETAVVEDDVLFWHGVTLGGIKRTSTDRHPKIRQGARLGAQSTLLGNIEIGAGAKIGPGSLVMADVPAGAIVTAPAAR